jgi:2-polyprenyl-6-methoxyphenol hydroxylase-like FAD-dependent oxidoreductase
MIFGRRAFFGYVPDGTGGTVWFANVPRHQSSRVEREPTTAEEWKQWLTSLFADDRGPASKLIAAGSLQLAAGNTYDLPSVPVWHKAPFIIIGDAAHAPSPSSGQGASMGLEDGVVLAKCLRDERGIPNAFQTFERIRRPRRTNRRTRRAQ